MRLLFVAVPLLLVLTACGQRAGSAPDPLRGRTFIATEVTEDGKPREMTAELSVEFTDDGRLIARAGCNMMQGEVDTSDSKITIGGEGLGMTGMGCDPERHEQDSFVSSVLGSTPSWELAGDRLTITSGTTTFEMAPRELVTPDRDLVGTTWELDTVVDGQTASSMPAGAEPVTLVFDGTKVVADTHCNGVTAEYTVSGDTIVFDLGVMTKMACPPEIMLGEDAVVDVLSGDAKYEITADKLSLDGSSGKGIQLHAK
ncbi:META domain-containing protein [Actinophytocola oryzae]|uniref:Heat shock protein HslJ n=1 Tax=Actinophytocola oryzae TaxID=502181 RepID=A0A4V6Q6H0_9PSEU|nr:META domain-containing protein [Actinophytocola oryzae]TDV36801.1 heat shock protein HslJ [Actinophytocola oryzae]